MKIEKLNNHQIRCTLTKEDLAMRHIKLSELAYGSEKAKLLFRDMMQQAATDFGFEADDIPLMIEAIPLSPETIVLIITKVESPDELDTRFSNFTQGNEDYDDPDSLAEDYEEEDEDTDTSEDDQPSVYQLFDKMKEDLLKDQSSAPENTEAEEKQDQPSNLIHSFSFKDLDSAITLSHSLNGFYRGHNTLFKDKNGTYYLVLHQGEHSNADFKRVNHKAAEYLKPERTAPGSEAFFNEHLKIIIPEKALQSLSEI